ncbi:thiamine pyrophosphate-binding protein [Aquibium sp. LZ166]|uniref:Thiamine pyrophosphate-binding protein n=1 Tax=Aquibium pacificus TaxID=3153579 RepID=A0ABV3SG38_9HYPH
MNLENRSEAVEKIGLRQSEQPVDPDPVPRWGSDVIARVLGDFDCRYIALNPGASYRGLHDSLVNHLGNENPRMLICLHEEHAVALAHGFAKVAEKPMLAAVHSNVGLMHASMAVFNAWCDRVPLILIGATGPVDASERRPWIDWIHTSRDQGALVRNYTKWDDQPASVPATVEALLRARNIAMTAPRGPVYVCLDVSVQESLLTEEIALPALARFAPPEDPTPSRAAVETALNWLLEAERPVVLAGRVSRSMEDWQRRIELVEETGALVITDMRMPAAFPVAHERHAALGNLIMPPAAREVLSRADVILSLDWLDVGGTLAQVGGGATEARLIHASMETTLANGWAQDVMALAAVDLPVMTTADKFTAALVEGLAGRSRTRDTNWTIAPKARTSRAERPSQPSSEAITLVTLAEAVEEAGSSFDVTLIRLPIGWPADGCHFDHPLAYLGGDGGGGIGSGPGMSVGAALALKDTDRLPVAVLGDGDLLMGCSALWTAARYDIPLLVIVANNRSYFNDEMHQKVVAERRDRAIENKWIGQHIREPAVDLVGLAKAQGWSESTRVDHPAELQQAILTGMQLVRAGKQVLIEVMTEAGYHSGVVNK